MHIVHLLTILLQYQGAKNEDDDDDTEWAVDVSEEAVRARMQDLTDGAKNMTINDDLEKTEKERMDLLYEQASTIFNFIINCKTYCFKRNCLV